MNILVVAGSTGGHYFPAVALAEKIRELRPDINVSFAGEKKIKNLEIWKEKGFEFSAVPVLRRNKKGILILSTFIIAVFALLRSLLLLSRKRINLVLCMGSYTTVLIGIAGLLTGRKVILHEQNFFPGLANRILNRLGIPAAITFPDTRRFLKKTVFTGLPIRKEFLLSEKEFEKYGLSPKKFTILVLGGSQGARFINQIVCDCICLFDPEKFQIIHITGRNDYSSVKSAYAGKRIARYLKDFTYEIPQLMNLADIAIARAGAGTIAELSLKAIPSILIPYPFGGGHQRFNAVKAQEKGCILIEQHRASPQMVFEGILKIQSEIEERRKNFASLQICDVNGNLAKLCLKLIGEYG